MCQKELFEVLYLWPVVDDVFSMFLLLLCHVPIAILVSSFPSSAVMAVFQESNHAKTSFNEEIGGRSGPKVLVSDAELPILSENLGKTWCNALELLWKPSN